VKESDPKLLDLQSALAEVQRLREENVRLRSLLQEHGIQLPVVQPLTGIPIRTSTQIAHTPVLKAEQRIALSGAFSTDATTFMLQTLTADVIKSSEIEGEKLDAEQVRSSIARRLGMDIGALKPADRDVEGVVEMMLDATRHYDQPLTKGRYSLGTQLFFRLGEAVCAESG
jgi:fumarylacetoacetate (FAA) hydrolase family protein